MEALEEAFSSTQPQESELLSLVHSRLLCTRRELKALKPGEIKYPYRYVSIYVDCVCGVICGGERRGAFLVSFFLSPLLYVGGVCRYFTVSTGKPCVLTPFSVFKGACRNTRCLLCTAPLVRPPLRCTEVGELGLA